VEAIDEWTRAALSGAAEPAGVRPRLRPVAFERLAAALAPEGLLATGAALALPDPEAKAWRLAHRARCLAFEAELGRLLGELAEARVPALVLKGPALSARLYGDPSARTYGDLDLLVDPADRHRAASCLDRLGYRLSIRPPRRPASAMRVMPVAYAISERGIPVDLHWGLATPELSWNGAPTPRSAATQTVRVGPLEVRTLADAPLLLYLAVHGGKHAFSRLGWLADFARMLAVASEASTDRALALATRLGFRRLLLAAVLLTERRTPVTPPPALRAAARGSHGADALARSFRPPEPPPGPDLRMPFARRERAHDAVRDGIGTLLGAFEPRWEEPSRWPGPVRRLARAATLLARHRPGRAP
jgi:hypothetical protein